MVPAALGVPFKAKSVASTPVTGSLKVTIIWAVVDVAVARSSSMLVTVGAVVSAVCANADSEREARRRVGKRHTHRVSWLGIFSEWRDLYSILRSLKGGSPI